MSWPSSSRHAFQNKSNMCHLLSVKYASRTVSNCEEGWATAEDTRVDRERRGWPSPQIRSRLCASRISLSSINCPVPTSKKPRPARLLLTHRLLKNSRPITEHSRPAFTNAWPFFHTNILPRTSLGRRIFSPWVSTKGIAGLRMKFPQRTCASARYTRLIVLPRFLCVWLRNSRAELLSSAQHSHAKFKT